MQETIVQWQFPLTYYTTVQKYLHTDTDSASVTLTDINVWLSSVECSRSYKRRQTTAWTSAYSDAACHDEIGN